MRARSASWPRLTASERRRGRTNQARFPEPPIVGTWSEANPSNRATAHRHASVALYRDLMRWLNETFQAHPDLDPQLVHPSPSLDSMPEYPTYSDNPTLQAANSPVYNAPCSFPKLIWTALAVALPGGDVRRSGYRSRTRVRTVGERGLRRLGSVRIASNVQDRNLIAAKLLNLACSLPNRIEKRLTAGSKDEEESGHQEQCNGRDVDYAH